MAKVKYTPEDEKSDWIRHHKRILSGELKIDLRRSYHYDSALGRKKTKKEIMEQSKEYLRNAGEL